MRTTTTLATQLATTPRQEQLLPAVGYLRLSDSRVEGELDTRIEKLNQGATALGWYLTEILMERDESRRNTGVSAWKQQTIRHPDGRVEFRVIRPEFDRLCLGLQTGRWTRVLTEDMSRLLRRGRDNEKLIDSAAVHQADVLSLSGTISLHQGGTDPEIQMARMMAGMAEQFSRDMSRRVSNGRERHAATSWGGGRRPYGYQPAPGTVKHHRTLVQVPAEAAEIRRAAAGILLGTISLKGATRDLRERQVPTVTGQPWETRSLRGILTNGAVAGMAVRQGQVLGQAAWYDERILDEEVMGELLGREVQPGQVWQELREKLLDPERRTHSGSGNEPRWLLSCFATCGICGDTLKIGGAGKGRSAAYVGSDCGHVRRNAYHVDKLITDLIIRWLDRYGSSDRLRPRAAGDDEYAQSIRGELSRLRAGRKLLVTLLGNGDRDALAEIRLKDRAIEKLTAQLASLAAQPDPIPEFREGTPAQLIWDTLTMPRKRAVVQALLESVTVLRAPRTGSVFHPESVDIRWRPETGAK